MWSESRQTLPLRAEMNKHKIEVTQEDIEQGVALSPYGCPVACAVKRQFPDVFVSVCNTSIWVGPMCFKANDDISDFISEFDCGGPSKCKPFSFTLEPW